MTCGSSFHPIPSLLQCLPQSHAKPGSTPLPAPGGSGRTPPLMGGGVA